MNVFSLLRKPVQRAIAEKGISTPTEPQTKAIPLILDGRNVLLIAPTGTGKTESAILPILDFLIALPERKGISVLYITPLRALNRDMLERLAWWCMRLDIKLAVRHGDTDVRERAAQSRTPPVILITTPETLQAILTGRILREHLKNVRWVVVDEVHELACDKRGSQLSLALERLRYLAGEFQVIGLSATIGTPEMVAGFLAGMHRECEIVQVPVARDIELQILYPKPEPSDYELARRLYSYPEVAARLRVMRELIEAHRSALLFTNTRSIAEVLSSRFRIWDFSIPIGIHHGSLSKPSRVSAERELKDGGLRGIVCTSSLELGIDIGRLDLVIQYNSPRQVTRLLQRVGRSGHIIGGVAKGIIITQDSEDFFEALAIARRSLEESLEPVNMPQKPLDALTHQIAGLLIEKWRWEIREAMDLFRKAYPYRNLTEKEFKKVLEYMGSRFPRLVYLPPEGDEFVKPKWRKELYRYYFENLSMIPDEKHFLVIDEETDSPIGLLDEAFVAEHGEPMTKFVERGSIWKIIHVYRDRVYVRSDDDPTGAIPSWVGEELPVPYKVAQEVGRIRGRIEKGIRDGFDKIADDICMEYPCDRYELEKSISEISEQVSMGIPVPTDDRITIERWEDYLIIQCSFGLLVNRTLSRIISYILSDKLGVPIGFQCDAYRIIMRTDAPPESVRSILIGLHKMDIPDLAISSVIRTEIFKRRMVHVARKFGAIAKDADLSALSLANLMKSFEGTSIYDETVSTVMSTDADVDRTAEVMERIGDGEIGIIIFGEGDISPIARIGMEEIGRKYDIIPPEKMRRLLIESIRATLLSESLTLVCIDCWDYVDVKRVHSLPEHIICPGCGSEMIGAVNQPEERVMRICESRMTGREVPKKDKRLFDDVTGSAELVSIYGRTAAMVLAGKGIRPVDAKEILGEEKSGDSLIELVIEYQKRSLKRRFFVS